MEAAVSSSDYVGYGPEYSMPPRPVERSKETPENPPAETENSFATAGASAFSENQGQEAMLLSYANTLDPLWV